MTYYFSTDFGTNLGSFKCDSYGAAVAYLRTVGIVVVTP